MKAILLVIWSIFVIKISTSAQNLINNPEFDDYSTFYDSNYNLIYQPDFWYYDKKDSSHPIYFSSDRFLNKAISDNFHPDADLIRQGQKVNYLCVSLLPKSQKAYTTLKEPLKKGNKYHLMIDIKAVDLSNCFSDLLIGFSGCSGCKADLDVLQFSLPDSLCDGSLYHNWLTLSKIFTAKGNESVFVISGGSTQDYIKIINANPGKFCKSPFQNSFKLMYFIDNISLTAIDSKNDSSITEHMDSLNIGQSIILQNIYFDFDKYVLLKESFPFLDKIAAYLKEKTNVRILVSGHTDNIGTIEYNDELSNKRAKSIVEFLTNKGIAQYRLQSAGLGSRFPVDSNDTDEGRQKNRRIEIKIIDK